MSSHSSLCGVFLIGDSITDETVTLIPTKFCSVIKISKYTSWVSHQVRVCCLRFLCYIETQ